MSSERKTGIEGVFSKGRKFVAMVYVRGERRFLGKFDSVAQASEKIADFTKRHEGEWAA